MSGKIFVVTNRKLIKKGTLIDVIEAAVRGGADGIILREKDLNTSELIKLVSNIKYVLGDKIPLIINGDYETAINTRAKGLHLSYNNFMNFNLEYKGIKGVSIHSLKEGILAEKKGADYVLAGHIFNTSCKEGKEGKGLNYLKNICDNLTIPVIAIGGINEENIFQVMQCGSQGVAVMSSVMESTHVEKYIKTLKNQNN